MRIEHARETDLNFVRSSWLRSYHRSPHTRKWSDKDYFSKQRPLVEALIARSEILVARPDDWPDGIFGWICFERSDADFTLHYAYSKTAYRRQGVARALLEAADPQGNPTFTHLTMPAASWVPGWKHKKVYR